MATKTNLVDTIGDNALCSIILSGEIPDGIPTEWYDENIKKLDSYALSGTNGLTSVEFINLNNVGEYALSRCLDLITAILPKVSTVPASCFAYDSSLRTVVLRSDGVLYINGSAFYNCLNLEELDVGDAIVNFSGGSNFINCYELKSFKAKQIRANSSYDTEIFSRCYRLKTIQLSVPLTEIKNWYNHDYCLKDFDFSEVTQFNSTFMQTSITKIELPKVQRLGIVNAFACSRVFTLDLSCTYLNVETLNMMFSLYELILRSDSVVTTNGSPLLQVPLCHGIGWIYVPDDLVNSYKADTYWSTYSDIICSINEYPKPFNVVESIQDSWETIVSEPNPETKYSIGDTKIFDFNGQKCIAVIVGFNQDNLSDGSGKAKITWMTKNICTTQFEYNVCDPQWGVLDEILNDDFYLQIESPVRNAIKEVTKSCRIYNESTSQLEFVNKQYKLWIPSMHEITLNSQYSYDIDDLHYSYFDSLNPLFGFGLMPDDFTHNPSYVITRTMTAKRTIAMINCSRFDKANYNTAGFLLFGFCT